MGPLFSILLSLICIVVFLTTVSAIAYALKDKKARSIFIGVVIAFVVSIFILIAFQFYLNSNPSYVFQNAFDIDPPADVSSLQGEISDAFDLKETWLCFKAQRATVEEIIIKRRMQEVGRAEALAADFTATTGAPDYWKPFVSESTKFYTSSDGSEKLIYNEQEGEVFYRAWKLQ